jgi:hypothetical protein
VKAAFKSLLPNMLGKQNASSLAKADIRGIAIDGETATPTNFSVSASLDDYHMNPYLGNCTGKPLGTRGHTRTCTRREPVPL